MILFEHVVGHTIARSTQPINIPNDSGSACEAKGIKRCHGLTSKKTYPVISPVERA